MHVIVKVNVLKETIYNDNYRGSKNNYGSGKHCIAEALLHFTF